jgi:hypothetical protein
MAQQFFANEDYRLLAIPQSSGIPSPSPTKIENKSTKCLCMDKQTITNTLRVIYTSCQCADHTFSFGNGQIQPTSTKCLCESLKPLRQNDEGICNGQFSNNKSGAVINCNCKLLVVTGGQQKCIGE